MICSATLTLGSSIPHPEVTGYPIEQLNSYFDSPLFGVKFDYNPSISTNNTIDLIIDLVNKTDFPREDPDPKENNIIGLVGHEAQDIKSAFFALEQVKRTQKFPSFDVMEWYSVVPFVKYLHHFSLPTGENVILGNDFLGLALKINGSGFNPAQYQLGYGDIPSAFLEFLIPDIEESSLSASGESIIKIQETWNEFKVDISYYNLKFLFQSSTIDLENFIDPQLLYLEEKELIDEHILIIQFDKITFSFSTRKYSHHSTSGVETLSEVSIGNVINLLINEELPDEQDWLHSFNYEIEKEFKELFLINEVFSWYQGSDIITRLNQFEDISLSLLTAQNIGILNGNQAVDDIQVIVDDQNKTAMELAQGNITATEAVSVNHNQSLLFSGQIQGRNFAIQQERETDEILLVPIEVKIIGLNQQNGIVSKQLFLQETSLLSELVAACVKNFIADPDVSLLSTHQLSSLGKLSLDSARIIQDYSITDWVGTQSTFNLLHFAVKDSPDSPETSRINQITYIPVLPGVMALGIISLIVKKKKRSTF